MKLWTLFRTQVIYCLHLIKKKVEEKMNNNYMLGTCIFIFECQIQCITFMCCSCIYVLQTYIPMQACNIQVSKPPDSVEVFEEPRFFWSSLTLCWWTISKKNFVCYVNFRPGLVSCSWLPNWLVSRQANTYCRYTLTKFLCWNKYDSSSCPLYSRRHCSVCTSFY